MDDAAEDRGGHAGRTVEELSCGDGSRAVGRVGPGGADRARVRSRRRPAPRDPAPGGRRRPRPAGRVHLRPGPARSGTSRRGRARCAITISTPMRDRLFVTVPGVDARRRARDARDRAAPRLPGQAARLRVRDALGGGQLSNQILRYRDDTGAASHRTVLFSSVAGELEPVPQRRADRVRSRRHAVRDRRRRPRLLERAGPDRRGPRQDHPHRRRTATSRPTTRSTTGCGSSGSATRSASRSTRGPAPCGRRRTGPSATTRST